MQFKDIVNRDLVNLKNCNEEPIHIPGSIQPHGFLLAADRETGVIRFCSGNIREFTGAGHEQILGKKPEQVFDEAFTGAYQDTGNIAPNNSKILATRLSGRDLSVTIHYSDRYVIFEGEPLLKDDIREGDLYTTSRRLLSYMEDSYTLVQLCAVVADAIKHITGYDRVMIYRFDKDYNGEVIAESKENNLEPFLGLHYPHTDIPPQARELYIRNQLRIIGDVGYVPVPLYTLDDGLSPQLDLSNSVLRSVSPIHIQYLNNMGVGATLNISLLHKDKLWGLIACHHYSPKYISHGIRLAAKLQGHFITSQIDVRLINEEHEIARQVHAAGDHIVAEKPELNHESIQELANNPNLLKLCNASGVSIVIGQTIYKNGQTPENTEIQKLSVYLQEYSGSEPYSTDSISRITSDLQHISARLPGIHYIPLQQGLADCVIWYRTETLSEINWAGDPNKAIEKDRNGLSPRKSFLSWKEIVKNTSKPWLSSELNASRNFANFLQNHLRSIHLFQEEEKQRKLANTLRETNAELENINWISTHDLQEPLRKIRMMSSMILNDELKAMPGDIYSKIMKMNHSAERMQVLIKDILKYTKVKHDHDAFEKVDIHMLMQEVAGDLREALLEKKAELHIGELPVILGIPFLLRQLFSNLMYNSLKFSAANRVPVITISASETLQETDKGAFSPFTTIHFSDNGIGFEKEYSELIFKIFSRLNTREKYQGSGIGLALCKKIMDKHEGKISAQGEQDHGATFFLHFPQ